MVLFTINACCFSFEEEGLMLPGEIGIPPAAAGAPKGPPLFFF